MRKLKPMHNMTSEAPSNIYRIRRRRRLSVLGIIALSPNFSNSNSSWAILTTVDNCGQLSGGAALASTIALAPRLQILVPLPGSSVQSSPPCQPIFHSQSSCWHFKNFLPITSTVSLFAFISPQLHYPCSTLVSLAPAARLLMFLTISISYCIFTQLFQHPCFVDMGWHIWQKCQMAGSLYRHRQ